MSHRLDPSIHEKLASFSRRRRNLIILRGLCAALAMLVATMVLVALIDRLFVLPDWARWTLSGAAYAAVIFVEWRSCLRLLMHAPGPRRLARLIEHAEPKLREDLLSAVELGDPRSAAEFDSEEFRALVQSDVAQRMETMKVERLLPVNLVRRYLGIAAVIVGALLLGLAWNGREFGTLLARALLPGANLARVSRFQIEIVAPGKPETIVPHGETVPLIVSVTGGRTSKAVLETFSKNGGREVVPMTPLAGDQFSATIQVARENVEYRVRAGDAMTRKYRLEAVARPHIASFVKEYRYPEYARLAPKVVTEENGDLAALEGSEVEVRLAANQPIKAAELRVEQGRKQFTVPLAPQPGNKLAGKLLLGASGTYRVFLVGAQTGFENKFSPEYEIRAEPDLAPQVELETPRQDLILPANEIVDVRGQASDDLGLTKVAQLVRVNDGPWKEFVLAKDAGPKAAVERRWDLFEQGAKAGDSITTKLLAIDLKGHRVESRPIQLTITASGFESKRLTSLETQRVLFTSITELRAEAEALEKRGIEARDQFERADAGDALRKQACVSGAGALEEFARKLGQVSALLTATLRTAGVGHESHDLVLLGRLLTKMDVGTLQPGRDSLEVATANPAADVADEFMREFADAASRSAQRARQLHEAARVFLGSEEIDVLAENMHVLMKEQERLHALAQNSGDDTKKWSQLAARMRAVTAETRALEAQLTTAAAHSANGDRLKRLQKEIEKQRGPVDAGLAAGASEKGLLEPTARLAKTIADAARTLLEFKRDLMSKPVEQVRQLLQEIGPTWTNFERLRQEVQVVNKNDKVPAETRARLVERRWEERGASFKQHADLEETRGNSDAYFVSDIRATTLALQGLKTMSAEPGWEKKLAEFDLGFRLLESGHNLAETLDGLNHLAVNERWEIDTPRSRTTNPRDWKWLEGRLRALPDELGKTQQPEPTRRSVEAARKLLEEARRMPAAKLVDDEMRDRFNPDRSPMGLPSDVDRVAALVKEALDLLRAPMEEARQRLAALAPKVSELAGQLAKETEQLKKETEEHVAKTAEKRPDEMIGEAQEKVARQRKLNEKITALKDLIRAEANQQNVLEKEGREQARDADDALALLREPPPKAEQALKDAAQVHQADLHEQAMREAAAEQQKLASALQQIAQHFQNAEQGKAEETRLALRATEEESGIKAQLDAQFSKAEDLAKMAQQSPEETLKQLEQALPANPEMRKELSQIAQDSLGAAQQKLTQATQAEQQIAKSLEQMTAQPPPANGTPQENAKQAAKQAVAAAEAARQAADEAVQMAKQAGNQTAADQARKARAEATEATKEAQQAVQATEQMAQPNQTAQAAQTAAEKAAQAAQKAQVAANAATEAKATAQQAAAQQTGDQQKKSEQTFKEADEAVQAAQRAAQAAKNAEAAAQQVAALSQPNAPTPPSSTSANPQLAQAAQQQTPIAQKTQQAGEDVARTGRHEERLQNPQTGAQLQQLGEAIQQTAAQEVPGAQQALAQAQTPKDARSAVNAASQELAKELGQLQAAAAPQQTAANEPAASSAPAQITPPASPAVAPASPQEQAWMARALDMLDAALHAQTPTSQPDANGQKQAAQNGAEDQPGKNQPGQQGKPADAASQAMAQAQAARAQAAQAAANAMRSARSEAAAQQPTGIDAKSEQMDRSESGALAQAPGKAYQTPGEGKTLKRGDWGKLPKQVAEELSQGQREAVASEYRSQVETYYRVIAERAKKP